MEVGRADTIFTKISREVPLPNFSSDSTYTLERWEGEWLGLGSNMHINEHNYNGYTEQTGKRKCTYPAIFIAKRTAQVDLDVQQ